MNDQLLQSPAVDLSPVTKRISDLESALAAVTRERETAQQDIARLTAERDEYERVELKHCQGEETLEELIHRLELFGENAFDAGYTNGIGVAIQAIAHEKEQRQPSTVWDGMNRAADAVMAVRDGTFVWVEDDDALGLTTPEPPREKA